MVSSKGRREGGLPHNSALCFPSSPFLRAPHPLFLAYVPSVRPSLSR